MHRIGANTRVRGARSEFVASRLALPPPAAGRETGDLIERTRILSIMASPLLPGRVLSCTVDEQSDLRTALFRTGLPVPVA